MLLITLGASLLGNMLTGKGILRADYEYKDFQSKEGKGILRDGYGNFNSPHSLTRFQMQKYYQNESKFSGVYSKYNFPEKRKDKDLEEYADVGTHWKCDLDKPFCR